jgi:peptidoglycan/xylan/chitin deacetylase (PgdA/CDA1 family)
MQFNMISKIAAVALMVVCISAKVIDQCQSPGMFAMCWDDGPTQNALDAVQRLSEAGVRATFHLTTQYFTDPKVVSIVKKIAAAGHVIGLRVDPSWNLKSMSDSQIRSGIVAQGKVLEDIIGYTPRYIRVSYNDYDDRIVNAIESTGFKITTHNLDVYDYQKTSIEIVKSVKMTLDLAFDQRSVITVQHDGSYQSVVAIPEIVNVAQSKGYRFVTLDECLGDSDVRQDAKFKLDAGSNSASDSKRTESKKPGPRLPWLGNSATSTSTSIMAIASSLVLGLLATLAL